MMSTAKHHKLERAQAQSYRRSIVSKLHSWIRIIFFAEVCLSALGFIVFPFTETGIVQSFEPYNKTDYCQHLTTKSGQSFMLSNDRFGDSQLAEGDTVYLEKNLLYKTEAIRVPGVDRDFFTASKMTWIYVQAIFMIAALASFYFSIPEDLPVKQGLSVMLEIICVLYLFV